VKPNDHPLISLHIPRQDQFRLWPEEQRAILTKLAALVIIQFGFPNLSLSIDQPGCESKKFATPSVSEYRRLDSSLPNGPR
jgi:hypothetical protein